ncbi:hypothetical protein AST13_02275 [Staphylococcus xylosus]|uniref:hypothetical protein n=1 Tax=Staphylococcus xylosus TaxID=1288 RepID=UPI000853012C|nr:hypothetical protein [Staphylococcus xylosus]OEL06885.1 hypothetical protein AST13_02275 [Staphylococcus xylosus]
MEIRLCDITNNKTNIRDYFIVEDGKILINSNHLYDVILDTDKVTLHQQAEMFDSKDEMFKKAKAFDEIVNLLKTSHLHYADDSLEDIEIIIDDYMEDKND